MTGLAMILVLVLTATSISGLPRDRCSSRSAPEAGTACADRDEETLDYFELFGDILTPTVAALFDDLRAELRAGASPLPAHVVTRLAPFFAGQSAGGITLSRSAIDKARFIVDPPRMREIFALAPAQVAAITVGDVVVFAPDTYQPDCVEGLALIGHELVHVAQYGALGRDRFLARYFLVETLKRSLGFGDDDRDVDLSRNRLEVAAYCHEEAICRALSQTGALAACDGRELPRCDRCPKTRPKALPSPPRPGLELTFSLDSRRQ